jgi:subtilase family serine protease
MRGLLSSRRLWGGVAAVVAVVTIVASVLYVRGASAATPYQTHPINVHPVYQHLDDPSTQGNVTVFGCQTRTSPNPAGWCYGPQQIQNAYDITPILNQGITGAGHTIVIVDAFQSPTITQDLALFDSAFNLPAPTFNQIAPDGLTPFNPADGNMVGWSAEISLDVEWAHAVAPGATIDLVLAKSNNDADILSATKYAVDHNLGEVISQSFGEGESCMDPNLLAAQHQVFQAANAKGITLIASAGDQGSAQPTCDGSSFFLSASTPASDPLVLSIGGTQLIASPVVLSPPPPPRVILDPGGVYQNEVVWNEVSKFGAAGGGGFSTIYSRPSYQAPFGVPNTSRGVPDVAYNAAIDGGVIAFWGVPFGPGAAFRFGGTSAGSPQWAGITALANQMAGKRLGFLHDDLYHLGKKPKQSADFHDITVGNNSFTDGVVSIPGFSATEGWDAATGLGTPDVAKLLPDLIATHVDNGGKNL